MPIKLAVFDMAGTTVYDDDNVAEVFVQAFDKYNLDISEVNINHLMGIKKTLAIKMVLDQTGAVYEDELVTKIHEEFVNGMLHHYRHSENVKPLPFSEELFSKLRAHNIKIGLNTGFPKLIADAIIARLGWEKQIDAYVASSEVPEGRPAAYMIQHLMEVTGVTDASEVCKTGDTEVDIREGRNSGCGLVIGITTGAYTKAELLSYDPDFVIDSLSELEPIIADFA